MAESAEIPIDSGGEPKSKASKKIEPRQHRKGPSGTVEGAILIGGAKVGKEVGRFALRETAKTLWQAWKSRKRLADVSTGVLAAAIAFNPDQTVDITKEAAKQFTEQTAKVLNLDHKMPSEVEMDRLTGKEQGQVDFFDLTFPWLNEAEKLQVRTMVDQEKKFLAENYPADATKRVYELTPLIKEVADEYGVPISYLRGITFVESAGDPEAYNVESEATGLTQFVPKTAIDLGFAPEEMKNPRTNLEAASIYLTNSYEQTGLWSEAVDTLHAGPGNVDLLKRTAFADWGIQLPSIVTDEDVALNVKIQKEAVFHHQKGPIQWLLNPKVQELLKDGSWDRHDIYLIRVYAAEELVHEYELAQQQLVTNGQ